MIARTVAACLVSILVSRASPAGADCSPVDRFTATEQAARVVFGRVVHLRQGGATFAAMQTLKGPRFPVRIELTYNPLAGISLVERERYLLSLGPNGAVLGGCGPRALRDNEESGLAVDAMKTWLSASDVVTRAAFLVRLGTRGVDLIALDALVYLAGRPILLAAITPAQRDELIAAIPTSRDERAYALSFILGRLHAVASLPAWIAWLGQRQPGANARPIQDALELMTNHHDPAYGVGRDFDAEKGAVLRAGWSRWLAAHGKEPLSRALTAGFSERVQRAIGLDDVVELAEVFSHSTDPLTRLVVLNACELINKRATSVIGQASATLDANAVEACAR